MFASKDLFFSKPSGYQISRSVRLRSSASAYFNRTPASTGSQTTWTWSGWFKRGTISSTVQTVLFCGQAATPAKDNWTKIVISGGDTLLVGTRVSAVDQFNLTTTQVFRDPSAWYHIVVAVDTTQGTASSRVKIYVNGVQVTVFSTATYPSLNYAVPYVNVSGQSNFIGRYLDNVYEYLDGYLTEINFIDGLALTPSSFGQTNTITGVWQPIKYTGTYGTNGFYLNFSDNSAATAAAIGKDYSGNSNNWTPNNISVTAGVTYDSMLDVPTLFADGGTGRGNYAVMNPLWQGRTNAPTNGNLDYPASSVGIGTMDVSLFSSYWEITSTGGTTTSSVYSTSAATTVGVTTGLTYGFRFNSSTGALDYTTNGSTFTSLATGLTSGPYFVYVSTAAATTASFNGGQRPFTYTPPTGFVALNTQNLPTPTISNGATVMAATTYAGTGATQSIVNSGNNTGAISFKPDLVWIKARNAVANHALFDSIRSTGKVIQSNTTAAEATDNTTLTSFDSAGFSLGAAAGSYVVNTNTYTFVAWQWQAGQGSTSSNTSGSITSTVSVNATAGFSVVTYTGTGANATVGHGLGVAPKMIFVKKRSAIQSWSVYHASLANTQYLVLDTTAAVATLATMWNSTSPTSSVFSIGTDGNVNTSTATYVAYCFSAVAGYSAFGSYTGNGSADGPFVYTGLKTRWLMIKRTDTAGYGWNIYDTARSDFNQAQKFVQANATNVETDNAAYAFDILSNGFKARNTDALINASGGTYIFATFAENPFKNSLAR